MIGSPKDIEFYGKFFMAMSASVTESEPGTTLSTLRLQVLLETQLHLLDGGGLRIGEDPFKTRLRGRRMDEMVGLASVAEVEVEGGEGRTVPSGCKLDRWRVVDHLVYLILNFIISKLARRYLRDLLKS